MKRQQPNLFKRQAGVTLLESLIAMLIGSIGLLAVASMQFNGLRTNNAAYWRSQAAILAQDISDKMRANLTIARIGGYDTAGTLRNTVSAADLAEWDARVTSLLPAGVATNVCANPCQLGSAYTITVQWDERRDGNIEQFVLEVTP